MEWISLACAVLGCCGCVAVAVVALLGILLWLGSLPETPEGARDELVTMVQDSAPEHTDHEGDMTPEQSTVLNQVGRELLTGTADDAIALIDEHLPTAGGDFRQGLLNQRAGALWMADRFEEARDCYLTQLEDHPTDVTALGNLVEAEARLGDTATFLATLERWRQAGGTPPDPERYHELVAMLEAEEEDD